jgi:uncharacterized membrane protein
MLTTRQMQNAIGVILMLGALFSAFLVLIGGILFLGHHGAQIMQANSLPVSSHPITIRHFWDIIPYFSALNLIELGIFSLVLTQVVRVLLLCGFYFIERDYLFTFISLFIFFMLIYGIIWRT